MARRVILLLSFLIASSAARAEDLLAVYERALANDPQIREADATRRAAREAKPQALGVLLPQLAGSAGYTKDRSDNAPTNFVIGDQVIPILGSNGNVTRKNWSLNLQQSLFSWANWMALKSADHQVAQAEADYAAAQQSLISRVAGRYFDVLAAQDNVDAQQSAFDSISRQLDQANKRFEVGLIAITDVQEAKAARDAAAAAVIDAKRQLETTRELLREYTAELSTNLAAPSDDMPLKSPQPADAQQWVDRSMDQNLTLVSSRLAADIARDAVRTTFGGHLPTLSLSASRGNSRNDSRTVYTDGSVSPSNSNQDDTQYTLNLSVPIFSGGVTQSRVRQSEYLWQAARERLTRTSRETERAARDAYLGVMSEISRVQALRQALESSQTALKATEAGYEVGTRTAVDVLEGRKNLVQAETNYSRSRYDYIINVLNLKLAAGTLDRAAVQEINGWLQQGKPASTAESAAPTPPR